MKPEEMFTDWGAIPVRADVIERHVSNYSFPGTLHPYVQSVNTGGRKLNVRMHQYCRISTNWYCASGEAESVQLECGPRIRTVRF